MNKQVEKKHYMFSHYSHKDRWVSYFHQLDEVLKLKPETLLEVGVGDKVLGSYIKENTPIKYESIDIAEDLQSDYVGSVLSIPVDDGSYDLICAFEVLEHLPFEDFEPALKELARVSKRHAVISLPHFGPPIQFYLKIPLLPSIRFSFKLPYSRKHIFNGEHYWELGKSGYSLRKIKESLNKYFRIKTHFIPFESQYHHFFVLEKK